MSSHHIVRENQEPALLLAGTRGVPMAVIGELLEWSPQIWVYETALTEVLQWDIKIDVVITTETSRNQWITALQHQAPVKIITHSPDEPPWPTVFFMLRSLKQSNINLVGVNPEQTGVIPEGINVCCICDGMRWVYVRSGIYEKWMPAGKRLQYVGEQVVATGVAPSGLTLYDGPVRLSSPGPFWVGEDLPDYSAL